LTLPSAEQELFFLHYYLIIINFLVFVLSFPSSVLFFSAVFFSSFFHYLGIHDMTTIKGGQVSAGATQTKKRKRKAWE